MTLNEISSYCLNKKTYFLDNDNLLDILVLSFSYICIFIFKFLPQNKYIDESFEGLILNWLEMYTIGFVFLRGLVYFEVFESFRHLINMMIGVTRSIIAVLFVFFYILLAFAIILTKSGEGFTILQSFKMSFLAFFGNLLDDTESSKKFHIRTWIIIFVMGIASALILSNFLIAIMSSKYNQLELEQTIISCKRKAHLILEYEIFYRWYNNNKIYRRPYFLTVITTDDEESNNNNVKRIKKRNKKNKNKKENRLAIGNIEKEIGDLNLKFLEFSEFFKNRKNKVNFENEEGIVVNKEENKKELKKLFSNDFKLNDEEDNKINEEENKYIKENKNIEEKNINKNNEEKNINKNNEEKFGMGNEEKFNKILDDKIEDKIEKVYLKINKRINRVEDTLGKKIDGFEKKMDRIYQLLIEKNKNKKIRNK